jgi:branched-chain amino acid transport system substrate-binding protein
MKNSRLIKTLAAALTASTLVLGFTGCSKSAGVSGASGSEKIKIGYIGALSGDSAVWGQAGLNGLKLTAKQINEKGGILGKQVEIVGLDGRGTPVDSMNALNKLIDQEKVVAVVGTNFSSINIPMAAVADQKKVPVIATAASSPKVTVDENGNLHPYSFRIGFTDPFQGKVLASYAVNELKAKTAAIITDIGSDYSVGVTQFFTEEFQKQGGTVAIKVDGRSGDNDFRAQLSNIAKASPDVVLIPWIYKDVALIANQARELGIKATFLGGDGWDSKELFSMAGEALEGSFYTSQPSFANPNTKTYHDDYLKEYNNLTPETEALLTNDGLLWIQDALTRAGKVDRTALRDALENTKGFKGLIGDMTIDPKTHDPEKPCSVYKIEASAAKYVGDFSPSK